MKPFTAFTLCLWIVFALSGFAQKNFVEGYVVTLSNDTLKGFIDYREGDYNPASVRFQDPPGKIIRYTPSMISGFFIHGKDHFESHTVSMDLAPMKLSELNVSDIRRVVPDTSVFLTLLVNGPASLYYLKDAHEKEHFYLKTRSDTLTGLLFKRFLKQTTESSTRDRHVLIENEIFKGQLSVFFTDCPEMKPEIIRSEYQRNDLMKLVIRYNDCTSPGSVTYQAPTRKVKIRLGILAGAGVQWFNYEGTLNTSSGSIDVPKTWFTPAFTSAAGVSLQLILPFLRGSCILYNDLLYKPFKSTVTYLSEKTVTFPITQTRADLTFDMGYLKLNTLIRYHYPNWTFRPFVNIGMSNSYALKTSTKKTVTVTRNDVPTVQEGNIFENPRKYEIGLVVGGGVTYKWFSLEARYEMGNGMSNVPTTATTDNSLLFLCSFTF